MDSLIKVISTKEQQDGSLLVELEVTEAAYSIILQDWFTNILEEQIQNESKTDL